MRKDAVKILRIGEETVLDDFVPGTMTERLEMPWSLTVSVCSKDKNLDPDQRMRRDIAELKPGAWKNMGVKFQKCLILNHSCQK